jgi:hypothetical protein
MSASEAKQVAEAKLHSVTAAEAASAAEVSDTKASAVKVPYYFVECKTAEIVKARSGYDRRRHAQLVWTCEMLLAPADAGAGQPTSLSDEMKAASTEHGAKTDTPPAAGAGADGVPTPRMGCVAAIQTWMDEYVHVARPTDVERHVMTEYTGRDYAAFWAFFKRYGPGWRSRETQMDCPHWYSAAACLMGLFAKSAPLPTVSRVFEGRGRYESPEGLQTADVGFTWTTTRPMSTTWNPDSALEFLPSQFFPSVVPVGQGCLVVYDIAHGARVPAISVEAIAPPGHRASDECEIVLPPFLRCRVTATRDIDSLQQQFEHGRGRGFALGCARSFGLVRVVFVELRD